MISDQYSGSASVSLMSLVVEAKLLSRWTEAVFDGAAAQKLNTLNLLRQDFVSLVLLGHLIVFRCEERHAQNTEAELWVTEGGTFWACVFSHGNYGVFGSFWEIRIYKSASHNYDWFKANWLEAAGNVYFIEITW